MARPVTLKSNVARYGFCTLAVARITLGFIFLWAFLDKWLGLGFATCRGDVTGTVQVGCSDSWLHGGSPTAGFLQFATRGPFGDFFHSLAGKTWVDWLFMIGLLAIGKALILGIAVRLAAIFGSVLLFMMWLSTLWPANNPVLDEHIIYILLLTLICIFADQQRFSLRSWWQKQPIVQKLPWLL